MRVCITITGADSRTNSEIAGPTSTSVSDVRWIARYEFGATAGEQGINMEFATKGKSLKGVSKLINKAFALIVSVCMVCTLTPAAAWASGASASGTSNFYDSGDGAASAASTVNAIVKDVNFDFIGGITFADTDTDVDGTNYQSVGELEKAISDRQLKATFKGEGLPETFSVTWYITEYVWDSTEHAYVKKGEKISLWDSGLMSKDDVTVIKNDDENYDFCYPQGGDTVDLKSKGIKERKRYELSVELVNKTSSESENGEGGSEGSSSSPSAIAKTAKASAIVTIFDNYSSQKLLAEGQPEISATGSFYVEAPSTYPFLEATDASSEISVAKMNNAALNQSTPEQVVEGTQLMLTNTSEGNLPYTGTLEVAIPLPLVSDGGINGYSVTDDGSETPVVKNPNNEGVTSLTVYTCDKSGIITSQPAKITWATDSSGNFVKDAAGNRIAVAVFSFIGTGTELGVFGVGVPLKEGQKTFNVKTTVVGPGIISPSPATVSEQEGTGTTTSEVVTIKQVMGTAQTYSAYVVTPGYVFSGFTMRVVGSDTSIEIKNSDLGYNTFTLNSSDYPGNIDENSTVEICATFAKQKSSTTTNTLTVNLKNANDDATGTLDVQPIGDNGSSGNKTNVLMGKNGSLDIASGQGALLTFYPGNDPATCKVKSVSVDGKDVAVQGNSLMLSVITKNTTVDVVYEVGMPAFVFTNNVKVHIDPDQNNSDYQPSYVTTSGTSESEHTYGQSCGSSLTIYTDNDPDYDLLRVVITKTDGSKVTFESKDPDVIEGVELVEASEDLASIAKTYNDYANSEIVIYNIVDVLDVELTYNYASVSISVEEGEGSSVVWGTPTTSYNANSLLKSNFVANKTSVGSFLEKAYADEPSEEPESKTLGSLRVNEQMQTKIWVAEGYAINNVTLNSQSVTNFLTRRTPAEGEFGPNGESILYTLTVYRGSSTGAVTGFDYNGDGVEDRVYYLQGRVSGGLTLSVETSPIVIPQKADCYVSTSVSSFGHGTISNSKKVPVGSTVQIQFVPDEGYTVDKVKIGEETIAYGDGNSYWMNGILGVEFVVNQSVQVQVSFTSGNTPPEANRPQYTVSATSGAGGTISPAGTYSVYEGTTETFTITPNTGYEISTFKVNGDDKESEISSSSTFTYDNISSDINVVVTFTKKDGVSSDTYQVSATIKEGGEGTVSPSDPTSVGAGSDVTFSIIPKYEENGDKWYISDVRARYRGSNGVFDKKGVSVFSFLEDFTLTLPDIQADTILEVTFAESDGGKNPKTGDDVPNPNESQTTRLNLSSDAIEVTPDNAPGAVVTPSLDDLYLIQNDAADPSKGIKGSLNLTVNVASGYKLAEPLYATSDGGGILVTNDADGNNVLTESDYTITKVSDGVYTVSIPGKYVNENFHMTVNTDSMTSSTSDTTLQTVTLETEGKGTISPSGTPGEDGKTITRVENGRSQTFSFIPDSGYKLLNVYVDNEKVNISNNIYTIPDIRKDMTVKAVFVKLDDGETQPSLIQHKVTVFNEGDNIDGGDIYISNNTLNVLDGGNLTITAVPKKGYKVSAQSVPTKTINASRTNLVRSGNSFELTNIKEDITVYITFTPDVQQLFCNFTVKSSGPGKTTPTGTQLVPDGSTQTVVLEPDDGCYVKLVKVNNEDKTGDVNPDTMTLSVGDIGINTAVEVEYTSEAAEKFGDLPAGDDNASRFMLKTSVSGGKGGVITPASVSVIEHSNFTFNITPYNGYEIDYVEDNGARRTDLSGITASGGALTLSDIVENHDIQVAFKSIDTSTVAGDYYTVFVSVVSSQYPYNGGKVSQAGYNVVPGGGSLPLSLIPEPGYKVSSIKISNAANETLSTTTEITGNTYTLFNVTEDKNVTIEFAPLGTGETSKTPLTHKIIASSTLNGSISQEGTLDIVDGANASFTFVPDSGYKLSYIVVDNNQIDAKYVTNNQYTFVGVTSDHSISAMFCPEDDNSIYYTITANAGANGKVDPSGSKVVVKTPEGDDPSLSITASGYYGYKPSKIEIVYDDANKVEIDASTGRQTGILSYATCEWNTTASKLTLSGISADLMVNAYFVKDESRTTQISVEPTFTCVEVTSGVGGYTSMNGISYVENPSDSSYWTTANVAEKNPRITVVPDSGKMVDEIRITYGDGSTTTINGDAAKTVTEQGYFTYDAKIASESGKVSINVSFKDIPAGTTIIEPLYYEINASYSAGGKIAPSGNVKVANGESVMIQLLPENGYEVASVTVDGQDAMDRITYTRKVLIENVTSNHSVSVTFSYVSKSTYYKVTARVAGDKTLGTVSPSEIDSVLEGSNVSINFYPSKSNVKISKIEIKKGDATTPTETLTSYTSSSYTFNNIDANYDLTVYFEEASEGDESALPYGSTITLNAKVGNGNGKVSPSEQTVAKGSPGIVYFAPDDGYMIDYVTFNGTVQRFSNSVTSYEATPVDGNDNTVVAYFKKITPKEYVTITPVIAGVGHATANSVTTEVGSSISIYVYPESGYTIDKVTIDGRDAPFSPAVSAGTAIQEGAVYSVYVINVDNVTKNTKVVITTRETSAEEKRIEIASHKLTINGEGAWIDPFGERMIPTGGKITITVTPFTGYYLSSIIATHTDGNRKVEETLTNNLVDGVLEFTMGDYDTEIYIKYLNVSENNPATVNVALTKATLEESDTSVLSFVSIGTDRNTAGTVIPINRNESGILMSDNGEPMPFIQGKSYTFYISGSYGGKQLQLVSARNNGEALSIGNNSLSVLLDASANLELVLREVEELPEPEDGYHVRAEVANNTGGTVSPPNALLNAENPTASFFFKPESNYWMIQSVDLYYYDEDGRETKREIGIDPARYKESTFVCNYADLTCDMKIVVTFCEAVLINVVWDNSQGYIMPNTSTGVLQLPKSEGEIKFVVAPYIDYYVESVTLASGKDSEAEDVTSNLKQGKEYAETLTGQGDGYSVVAVTEGGGVVTPYNDDGGDVTDGTDTQVTTESGDIVTVAFSSKSLDALAETGGSETISTAPTSKVFARAYGLTVPFNDDQDFKLEANFYKSQILETYYITATAGEHGRIDYAGISVDSTSSFTFEIAANSTPTFNFIPDNGYTVSSIKVNGGPLDFGNTGEGGTSYTFSPVTSDQRINVEFAQINGTTTGIDRLVKTAAGLAKTGDLTGPVVGLFLIIAAVGVGVMAVSVIRRRRQETVRPRR